MSYVVTESSPKNLYSTMVSWYNKNENLPQNDSGVFFGFSNFNRDKLYYCIEVLKKMYSTGWFTDDHSTRTNAFSKITDVLYSAFDGTVSKDGIKKFLNWVYTWAKTDADAVNYFTRGESYSFFDALTKDITGTVSNTFENVSETVSYGVNYPSVQSITPDTSTILKWGLIVGGGLLAVNILSNKLNKIF